MTLVLAFTTLAGFVSTLVALLAGIRAVGRLTRELERTKSQLGYERLARAVDLVDVEPWINHHTPPDRIPKRGGRIG